MLAGALALHRAGRLDEARALYEAVLQAQPLQFDALHLLGVIEQQQGRPAAALAWFDLAMGVDAASAALHANRGAALRELRRSDEALVSLDRALALDPAHAKALANRAAVRLDRGAAEQALADVERSLAIAPDDPAALYNRANALRLLGRHADALAACERVLPRLPGLLELHLHHGALLRNLGRPQQALASYERALAIDAGCAAALADRGHAFADLGRDAESAASYARAHALAPDLPWLSGQWLHARLKTCDWHGLHGAFAQLGQDIDAGRPVCEPFVAALAPLTAAQQRRCAETWSASQWPTVAARPQGGVGAPDGRIRLGYFSPDFGEHPVAHLIAGVAEQHDRTRFEVTAFAIRPAAPGALRERLQRGFERFVDVSDHGDAEIAGLARQHGIQIAIDLAGYTRGSRPGVFARRCAPVQVAWLGFPGTLGAPFIDYLVADAITVPDGCEDAYAERIVRLPHSYQPNDTKRPIAARAPARREPGLPDEGFVFCNFNNPAKITPEVFAAWMRLLNAQPGSVLWLAADAPATQHHLRDHARTHGVDPARLVFAPHRPLPEHLARHGAADLFLDTWPYNAHATASHALWAGLPLLTRLGETFAGRTAASLLHAIGLDELVAASKEDYEAMALALARDPDRLAALRRRLAENRSTHALFDIAGFTRSLETAFAAMWERQASGLPPDHIRVAR